MPIVLKFLHFRIRVWTVNKYNIISLTIAFVTFIIFVISWFAMHDLSKEYDQKLIEEGCDKATINRDSQQKIDYSKKMIGWKGLLQTNILLLSFTFGTIRLVSNLLTYILTMIAKALFDWPVDYLSICHISIGVISYIIITVLLQKGAFKEDLSIFFTYIIGCLLAVLMMIALVLPRNITISDIKFEVIFVILCLSARCFSYFVGQTQGKFLIFNTVNKESASFVDGFRSSVGSASRLLAVLLSYQVFLTPIYFVVPIVLVQLGMIILLLYRHTTGKL